MLRTDKLKCPPHKRLLSESAPRRPGNVTIALFQSCIDGFKEAAMRHPLPRHVMPGESLKLELCFPLPAGDYQGWHVGLVSEGRFWFHERGTEAPQLQFS